VEVTKLSTKRKKISAEQIHTWIQKKTSSKI